MSPAPPRSPSTSSPAAPPTSDPAPAAGPRRRLPAHSAASPARTTPWTTPPPPVDRTGPVYRRSGAAADAAHDRRAQPLGPCPDPRGRSDPRPRHAGGGGRAQRRRSAAIAAAGAGGADRDAAQMGERGPAPVSEPARTAVGA